MDIKEAIEILEQHQKWRCDNNVPSIYEQTDPRKLTNAINTALDKLKSDLLHSVVVSTECLTNKFNRMDAESNLKAVCKWLKEVKGITEIDMMDLINYMPEYEEWLKSTPKK